METLKNWALSLAVTCVITAVVSFFTPSGNFEKSVKILTALFLILGFSAPLFKLDFSTLALDETDGVESWINESLLEKEIENEVIKVLENEIINQITAYFSKQNIPYAEIAPDIEIDGNENITITSITIVLTADIDKRIIEDFVYQRFGIIPQIVIDSGDNYEFKQNQ